MERSFAKRLGGCALAVILGIFTPYIFAAPMFACFIYAFGGMIPFSIMSAVILASGFMTGGYMLAGMFALAYVIPSAIAVRMIGQKKSFTYRIKIGIVACLVGAFAAVTLAYAVIRRDLVKALIEGLRNTAASIGSDYMEGLVAFTIGPGDIVGSTGDAMSLVEKFNLLMDTYESVLPIAAPGFIIVTGLINGILMTLWPSYIYARNGGDLEYIYVSDWKIPRQLFGYLYITLIAAFILDAVGVPSSDIILMTSFSVFSVGTVIKAVVSLLSRMRRTGASPAKRTVFIILGLVFASQFLSIYGTLSSLFGSDGIIKVFLRSRAEKKNKEDDE